MGMLGTSKYVRYTVVYACLFTYNFIYGVTKGPSGNPFPLCLWTSFINASQLVMSASISAGLPCRHFHHTLVCSNLLGQTLGISFNCFYVKIEDISIWYEEVLECKTQCILMSYHRLRVGGHAYYGYDICRHETGLVIWIPRACSRAITFLWWIVLFQNRI